MTFLIFLPLVEQLWGCLSEITDFVHCRDPFVPLFGGRSLKRIPINSINIMSSALWCLLWQRSIANRCNLCSPVRDKAEIQLNASPSQLQSYNIIDLACNKYKKTNYWTSGPVKSQFSEWQIDAYTLPALVLTLNLHAFFSSLSILAPSNDMVPSCLHFKFPSDFSSWKWTRR